MRETAIAAAAAVLAAIAGFCSSSASAVDGAWKDGVWKFALDEQEQPSLVYVQNGKDVFFIGCGRAFALRVNYPGAADRKGGASVTISNGITSMVFQGEIEKAEAGDTGPVQFTQWDLGHRRQDPALYGKAWHGLEDRLLNLLDLKRPLTFSAGDRSYALPPVNAPNWKAHFKKYC